MAGTTTRMALYKPASGETVNLTTDLNNNWDKIDANLGFASCTSSTRPSTVWAGLCIYETNTGSTYVSNGTAPASASWVQIPNGGGTGGLTLTGSATTSDMITSKVTADTQQRLIINADGKMEWGSGSVTPLDTTLYRDSAGNKLKTDDAFDATLGITSSASLNATVASTASNVVTVSTAGDANKRFRVDGNGKLEWGAGGASAVDTNLYRSASNELTTDDSLVIVGNLTVSGIGQVTYVRKASDQSRASNVTPSNDNTLTFAMAASAVYDVECCVAFKSTSTTPDIRTAWTVPASATGVKFTLGATTTSGTYISRSDANASFTVDSFTTNEQYQLDSSGNSQMVYERGIVTTSSSGTFGFQWAQWTTSGTNLTCASGSFLRITRVA